MSTGRKPYKIAYTVVERHGRKIWLRVGAAFDNADGSVNIVLDAVPTNGTLQIRPHSTTDDRPIAREEPEPYDAAPLFVRRAS